MALSLKSLYKSALTLPTDGHHMEGQFDEEALIRNGTLLEDVAAVMEEILSPEARDALQVWTLTSKDKVIRFRLWFDETKIDDLTGLETVK